MSAQAWMLLVLNISLLMVGQVLLKWDLDRLNGFHWNNIVSTMLSPGIIAGLFFFVLGTLVWFRVLSVAPFSAAFAAQSSSYMLGIIIGWFFFDEAVPLTRWIGGLIILVGAYLVSLD